MSRRIFDIMVLLHLWNNILFLLTAIRTTGSTFSGTDKDIMHAIAGNPFMIRRWSMIDSTLFITIKKDNKAILDMSMGVGIVTNSTVQDGRMMLVYNHTIQELYLWFKNVSKEDEGIYEMKESFYRTNPIAVETEADTYEIKDGTWYLEIYVLGPGEIKTGYVGRNISMESDKSIKQSNLYNYDDRCALLTGSSCSVLTDSSLYGRLRCSNDDSGRKYKITIGNVSQRDAGLYKMGTGRNETGRCFFIIEDSPTFAVVGDNMTIGWFYNQQGIKRTLRVIHPNQGVMMLLPQTNSPQIKSSFRHRLLYSGDTLQSFMSFTLLNVRQSDAGLYTIETLHGNTIPGNKELNVEGTCTTGGCIQTTLDDVTSNIADTKLEVVTLKPIERQYLPLSVVIPVVTVAVVVSIAIIAMTGCLIWIQRRNSSKLEAVRRLAVEESQPTSFATPSIIKRHLSRSPLEEGWVSRLTLSNDLLHHTYADIPSESSVVVVDTTGYSTVLLSDVEDDNKGVHFIADHNSLRKMTDGGKLIACIKHSDDGNLDSYPTVYSLAKAADVVEYGYNCIVDGLDTRHEPHNIQSLYGKDTVTRRTDGLCKNEYEMMDIALAFDTCNTFEDYSIYSESTKYQTPLCPEQRRVLEQCETASFVTPSTMRRSTYVAPIEDTSTHAQVQERKAFSNAMLSVPFAAISTVSASLDNAWSSTDSLSEPDDDKSSVYCITNPKYTIGRTDEKTLVSCDKAAYDSVLDSCASTCTIGSATGCKEHIYKCILNGNSSSQVWQSILSLHTEIKEGPSIAFRNTTTLDKCATIGGPDSPLSRTEYEMVNISTDFDQDHTLQV